MTSLSEKTLLWILKGGLLAIPFIPLIVTRSMYFPFITGKNFAFRILIEILAVFWVWLMVVSPKYRPRISLITVAYGAFITALILATVFGISPYKSFWSSYERMEGLFGHLHLFLYFLMLGSALVSAKDWRLFFNVSIAVSAIVTIYGFVQLAGGAVIHLGSRVDAVFGNAAYLAVYLLFHLFLIMIFFAETQKSWLKGIYGALFFMEGAIFYYTASRGPILGFLVGAVLFAFILAILQRGRVRQLAAAIFLLVLFVPAAFYLVRNTELIRSSDTLVRFVDIVNDSATEGRLTVWKMALRGWQERPILGWGQESFTYIFSKYYEPSLWKNEPWFDRAHNVFLDWLTASGVLGLGAYLAMFGAAFFLLWRAFQKGNTGRYQVAGITAILTAHLFQNLFIFDNLTSYILFFAALSWVHSIALSDFSSGFPPASSGRANISMLGAVAVGISVLLVVYSFFMFNIKPIRAARSIIASLIVVNEIEPSGKADRLIAEAKRGIAMNTFGTTEIREQADQIKNRILQDSAIAIQDKQKYQAFVIEEMEKQRKEEPFDVRAMAFLAGVYSTAGRPNEAIATVNEALKISRKRQQFYFIAAEAYLSQNQFDNAIKAVRIAHELDPRYPEAFHNLAVVLIVSGRAKEAEDLIEEQFGTRIFADKKYVSAYLAIGDLGKVVRVWEKIVASSTASAEDHAELGSAYFQIGEKQKAIAEFQKAIELEPNFRSNGEQIIQQIRNTIGK